MNADVIAGLLLCAAALVALVIGTARAASREMPAPPPLTRPDALTDLDALTTTADLPRSFRAEA